MNLNELIENYGIKKSLSDSIKKELDGLNKEIKKSMLAEGLTEAVSDNYTAKYQVRKSESLDEDKVIEILIDNNIEGIIKTKAYIDEDALENAIYNGKLNADILKQINEAKIVKESAALVVKEK